LSRFKNSDVPRTNNMSTFSADGKRKTTIGN
jgi:hypothetical protein